MEGLLYGLGGTIGLTVLMLVVPGRRFFPIMLLLAVACLAGQWSMQHSSPGGCENGCSPGTQMGMVLTTVPALIGTVILVPASLIKAFVLYWRR